MDAYDTAIIPTEFGLNNTGVICYFNSFLQALAGCTAFTKAVLANAEYLKQTRTGSAVLTFVRMYTQLMDVSGASANILHALVSDLSVRRPHVRFGNNQESASEALVHLLDMMEPPTQSESPITRLFLHRFRCDLYCRTCKKIVSKKTDHAVNFNLFHLDRLKVQPTTAEEFSKAIRTQISTTEDYKCENCATAATGTTGAAFRVYNLTMIPEIIFCMFNLYVGYGGVRRARYFPEMLEFPALDGGKLLFLLVGQVEHMGSLTGGHYWARGLRRDGVYLTNDTSVTKSSFASTPNTYIVVYHYASSIPKKDDV